MRSKRLFCPYNCICPVSPHSSHEVEEHEGWESINDADAIAAPAVAGNSQEPLDLIEADDDEVVKLLNAYRRP